MNKELNKGKIIFKTIILTLIIEILLGGALSYFLYKNYKKISAAESGISDKFTNLDSKKVKLNIEDLNINNLTIDKNEKGIIYKGIFGEIKKEELEKSEKNTYTYSKSIIYSINKDNIKIYSLLRVLSKKGMLDKYTLNYLNSLLEKGESENNSDIDKKLIRFINSITNLALLLDYKTKEEIGNILNDFEEEYSYIIKDIFLKIRNKQFLEVGEVLNNYGEVGEIKNNIYGNISITSDEKFQYIINKMLSDKYYKNIEIVSQNIGVDKKLIISAISVEQLRYLTSNRALAKKLLLQNNFLVNFSKFSYGLGGIKVPTFIRINKYLKKNKPYIYNKYFKYYDDITKNSKEYLINLELEGIKITDEEKYNTEKIIEQLKKHYVGTLYVGGLLLYIQDSWKKAGYSIDDKPGVILTLYNMGNNRKPHANPGVGGALIKVSENKELYFGEIGYIFYYYIKYYLDI